ncbi:uncharacterized protein LOC131239697 [Magnolia sinica]|uniref:uncharacterized protein LOC131239697 n=1 Tax=Magnolia sinica TaxID=86752 RepID=UPI0026580F42|nr:uncharacterized protein LOC131239697 [Magnolia sinica]
MDKSWIHLSRVSNAYVSGAKEFLDFAFTNTSDRGRILCPCKNCNNNFWVSRQEAYDHIVCDGFNTSYTHWHFHGEATSSSIPNLDPNDDMHELLHDAFDFSGPDDQESDATYRPTQGLNTEAQQFFKLVEDADKELYPGCKKFSKLSFIIRLYHIKCLGGWSDKSFTMLLELLKDALPEGETLPRSFYETKKIIGDLGLKYNKIDACPNDCMLYWKDAVDEQSCGICGASRWKTFEHQSDDEATSSTAKERKIPAKILRHFPLKPRLQRLYMSSKTASSMKWHYECRTEDGMLRHPADSPAWKTFDHYHPTFSSDSRNVRLGLAADGFNPFKTMSIAHST